MDLIFFITLKKINTPHKIFLPTWYISTFRAELPVPHSCSEILAWWNFRPRTSTRCSLQPSHTPIPYLWKLGPHGSLGRDICSRLPWIRREAPRYARFGRDVEVATLILSGRRGSSHHLHWFGGPRRVRVDLPQSPL
jgi:hypothetical protein